MKKKNAVKKNLTPDRVAKELNQALGKSGEVRTLPEAFEVLKHLYSGMAGYAELCAGFSRDGVITAEVIDKFKGAVESVEKVEKNMFELIHYLLEENT